MALVVGFLVFLLLAAITRPAGPRRAIALLLIVYCVAASFTETGLGDASPYLLDVVVAASLVATPPGSLAGRARLLTARGASGEASGIAARSAPLS